MTDAVHLVGASGAPAIAPIPPVPPGGSSRQVDDQVRRLLDVARSSLGLDVAWVSSFVAGKQVYTHVVSRTGTGGPAAGTATDLRGSYCIRVLGGELPAVIPDVSAEPVARELEVTRTMGIGAYVGVPIHNADGTVRGMLCCTSERPQHSLSERDRSLVELLAAAVAGLTEGVAVDDREQRQHTIFDLISGVGRRHVLHPIVDVGTGVAVGFESLSRFDDPPYRPDLWFAAAAALDLLGPLEIAAARTGLTRLADHHGFVSVNLSASTIVVGGLRPVLLGIDPTRVVVELTEHAPVFDYAALAAALAPYRRVGLRLAIDDAGAGYASFRHILALQPDYIKMDISLVRDIDRDAVRQALAGSLVACARSSGAQLIAEGVETQAELDTLAALGVTLVQGYLMCRPCTDPMPGGYPRPARPVVDGGEPALTRPPGLGLEQVAGPLLDVVLAVTGLEACYVAVPRANGVLERIFVSGAGILEPPEPPEPVGRPWPELLFSDVPDREPSRPGAGEPATDSSPTPDASLNRPDGTP